MRALIKDTESLKGEIDTASSFTSPGLPFPDCLFDVENQVQAIDNPKPWSDQDLFDPFDIQDASDFLGKLGFGRSERDIRPFILGGTA
jgi:hypothetical protein